MLEAHLVKPKISALQRLAAAIVNDMEVLNPNYQLYVPGQCVLGFLKYRPEGLHLVPDNVFFSENASFLEDYKRKVDDGDLVIARSMSLPENVIDTLIKQAQSYTGATEPTKAPLPSSVESLSQYLPQ